VPCRTPTNHDFPEQSSGPLERWLVIVQIYEVGGVEEAVELARLGADHIGVLVGTGAFPREVSPLRARDIFAALPPSAKGVALSLSDDPDDVARVIETAMPDIVHIGAALELFPAAQTRKLRARFPGIPVMRSIPVTGAESIAAARQHEGAADWLLLDSHVPGDRQIGALGRTHDWSISRAIVDAVSIPCILAGGLGAANVAAAIAATRPAGVDSKTRTDREDGAGKDVVKVRQFVMAAGGEAARCRP
jgi:phosphoribosylanthranilate isomerase